MIRIGLCQKQTIFVDLIFRMPMEQQLHVTLLLRTTQYYDINQIEVDNIQYSIISIR